MEQIILAERLHQRLSDSPYRILVLKPDDVRMPVEMVETLEPKGDYRLLFNGQDLPCTVYPLHYKVNRGPRMSTTRINLPLARAYAIYELFARWQEVNGHGHPEQSPYMNRDFYRALVGLKYYQGDYLLCLGETLQNRGEEEL